MDRSRSERKMCCGTKREGNDGCCCCGFRRYPTREEEIERLKGYGEELEKEATAVAERIEQLQG